MSKVSSRVRKAFQSYWTFVLTFVCIGVLFILLIDLSLLHVVDIFKAIDNKQSSINIIKTDGTSASKHECDWYHHNDWWSLINVSNKQKEIYALESTYNYSIPTILNETDAQITANIVRNPRWHKSDKLPVLCNYTGKIFNIGIQKTGTTSIAAALQWLGYQCNYLENINIMKTCANHQLTIGYKNHLRFHRSWRPFSADDISHAFLNKNYTKDLYLLSFISQIFADTPWAFFYKLWDAWYPKSKYIYTVRASTYNRVNSAIKFELRTRYLMAKARGNNDIDIVEKYINSNKTILWNSFIENILMEHAALEEFAILMARNYEKHHENILNYFGKNRIGINKDVLILCLECENNPWQKIQTFLGCQWKHTKNGGIQKLNIEFPHKLSAVPYMNKYYLPKHFSLNWREYKKYRKITHDVLDSIYNTKYTPMQRMYNVSKNLWRFDIEKQRHLSRLISWNNSYMSLGKYILMQTNYSQINVFTGIH